MYDGEDISDVFDLNAARRGLQQRRQELQNECEANKKLQEKFESCHRMMRMQHEISFSSQSSEEYLEGETLDDLLSNDSHQSDWP